MKKFVVILCLVLVLILSGCHPSDPSFRTMKYKGYFTVGYDPDKQLTYLGEGILIDIVKEAGSRMGLEAPIYPVEPHTWQALLHNQDIDVMIDGENEEDLKTIGVYKVEALLVKPTGQAMDENSMIGVLDAGVCADAVESYKKYSYASYRYYGSSKELISDFENGVVDGMIISKLDAMKQSFEGYESESIFGRDIFLTVRSGDQAFFGKLNETLYKMVQDGTVQKLLEDKVG